MDQSQALTQLLKADFSVWDSRGAIFVSGHSLIISTADYFSLMIDFKKCNSLSLKYSEVAVGMSGFLNGVQISS